MKKKIFFFLLCAFCAVFTGCASSTTTGEPVIEQSVSQDSLEKTDTTEVFNGYDIPEDLAERYFDRFQPFFSVEEYVELCNIATAISATPEWPLNKHLFSVYQKNTTYDTNEDRFLLLDTSGNIVKDYGEENWAAVGKPDYVGEYSFIPNTNDLDGHDIYNSKGEFVGTFDDDGQINEMAALGDEYYIFYTSGNGTYYMNVLHPNGECYFIHVPRDLWPIAGEEIQIGTLCDGLFSMRYDLMTSGACGFYFDAYGEKIIDLSFETRNFNIYELGDFKDGQAEIKFIGADDKNYTGIIDKNGNFVTEPVAD